MKYPLAFSLFLLAGTVSAQERLTPEKLWSLGRVSSEGLSASGKTLYYGVKHTDWKTEKSVTKHYRLSLAQGSLGRLYARTGRAAEASRATDQALFAAQKTDETREKS